MAEFLRTRLEDSSVPFEVASYEAEPDRPNVVARVGNSGRGSVLLTGHIDVVPADVDESISITDLVSTVDTYRVVLERLLS